MSNPDFSLRVNNAFSADTAVIDTLYAQEAIIVDEELEFTDILVTGTADVLGAATFASTINDTTVSTDANNNTIVGSGSTGSAISGSTNIAFGYNTTSSVDVAGDNNIIVGNANVVVGMSSTADNNVFVGNTLGPITGEFTGANNVHIGNTQMIVTTSGEENVVIGYNILPFAAATGVDNNVIIGSGSGSNLLTDSTQNVLVGSGADVRDSTLSPGSIQFGVSIGPSARSTHSAVGIGRNSDAATDFAVAIGALARADDSAGVGAVAIGREALATGEDSFAVGRNTEATGDNSVAIGGATGTGAQATGANSVAIGATAQATQPHTIAIGNAADAGHQGAICIGPTAASVTPYSVNLEGPYAQAATIDGTNATAMPVNYSGNSLLVYVGGAKYMIPLVIAS